MRLIRMLSHWHNWFPKTMQVFYPCEHDIPYVYCKCQTFCVAVGHIVSLLRQLCAHTTVSFTKKHPKYTLVTLLKHFLPGNMINDIFVSCYCLPSDVRFVTTNLVSSQISPSCFQDLRKRPYAYVTLWPIWNFNGDV